MFRSLTNPTIFDRVKALAGPISQNIHERINAFMAATIAKKKTELKPFNKMHLTIHTMHIDLRLVADKMVFLRIIFSRLFNIKEMSDLIDNAFIGKPFTLAFANSNDLFSEGECDYPKRQIRIQKDLNLGNIVSTILFELCNANNETLSRTVVENFHHENDYALAMERAEFSTYQKHISYLKLLLSNIDMICTLDSIGVDVSEIEKEVTDAYQNFDEYWQGVNTPSANKSKCHSEYYRDHFRQLKNKIAEPMPVILPTPITPAFLAAKNLSTAPIAKLIVSNEAKELLASIKQNPQALSLLERYPPQLVASLLRRATKINVPAFQRLNATEQRLFLSKFAFHKLQPCKTSISIENNHLLHVIPGISRSN